MILAGIYILVKIIISVVTGVDQFGNGCTCLYPRQFPDMDTTSVKGCKLALDNFSSFSGSVQTDIQPCTSLVNARIQGSFQLGKQPGCVTK